MTPSSSEAIGAPNSDERERLRKAGEEAIAIAADPNCDVSLALAVDHIDHIGKSIAGLRMILAMTPRERELLGATLAVLQGDDEALERLGCTDEEWAALEAKIDAADIAMFGAGKPVERNHV